MCRDKLIVGIVVLVLAVSLAWSVVKHATTSLHISFADEQTAMFEEMVRAASDAMSKSPPNVRDAQGMLISLDSYYPSGTKQIKGSRLDRITERARSSARARIVEMLLQVNETTGIALDTTGTKNKINPNEKVGGQSDARANGN